MGTNSAYDNKLRLLKVGIGVLYIEIWLRFKSSHTIGSFYFTETLITLEIRVGIFIALIPYGSVCSPVVIPSDGIFTLTVGIKLMTAWAAPHS